MGVAALVVSALLTACSNTKTVGGSGGLGGSPAPITTSPGISGAPAPTPTGVTATSKPTATGKPKSSSKPGGPGSVTVAATVATPADVVTADCPHHFMVKGTISVSAGPVDVTYAWLRGNETPTHPITLHFAGTGKQTTNVVDNDAVALADGATTDTIELLSPVKADAPNRSFNLVCSASGTTPKRSPVSALCPYEVVFSTVLSVDIPGESVDYVWMYSDGSSDPETYAFASGVTTARVSSKARLITSKLTAYVHLAAGNTGRTTATCAAL